MKYTFEKDFELVIRLAERYASWSNHNRDNNGYAPRFVDYMQTQAYQDTIDNYEAGN